MRSIVAFETLQEVSTKESSLAGSSSELARSGGGRRVTVRVVKLL